MSFLWSWPTALHLKRADCRSDFRSDCPPKSRDRKKPAQTRNTAQPESADPGYSLSPSCCKALSDAINSTPAKHPVCAPISISSITLGHIPPSLEIVEVSSFSFSSFVALFKFSYQGDAIIKLHTMLESNPLDLYRITTPEFIKPEFLLADASLKLPLKLEISSLQLSGLVTIVCQLPEESRSAGTGDLRDKLRSVFSSMLDGSEHPLTHLEDTAGQSAAPNNPGVNVIFKNDPLISLHVTSSLAREAPKVSETLKQEVKEMIKEFINDDIPNLIRDVSRYVIEQPTASFSFEEFFEHAERMEAEKQRKAKLEAEESSRLTALIDLLPDIPTLIKSNKSLQWLTTPFSSLIEHGFKSQNTLALETKTISEFCYRPNLPKYQKPNVNSATSESQPETHRSPEEDVVKLPVEQVAQYFYSQSNSSRRKSRDSLATPLSSRKEANSSQKKPRGSRRRARRKISLHSLRSSPSANTTCESIGTPNMDDAQLGFSSPSSVFTTGTGSTDLRSLSFSRSQSPVPRMELSGDAYRFVSEAELQDALRFRGTSSPVVPPAQSAGQNLGISDATLEPSLMLRSQSEYPARNSGPGAVTDGFRYSSASASVSLSNCASPKPPRYSSPSFSGSIPEISGWLPGSPSLRLSDCAIEDDGVIPSRMMTNSFKRGRPNRRFSSNRYVSEDAKESQGAFFTSNTFLEPVMGFDDPFAYNEKSASAGGV